MLDDETVYACEQLLSASVLYNLTTFVPVLVALIQKDKVSFSALDVPCLSNCKSSDLVFYRLFPVSLLRSTFRPISLMLIFMLLRFRFLTFFADLFISGSLFLSSGDYFIALGDSFGS